MKRGTGKTTRRMLKMASDLMTHRNETVFMFITPMCENPTRSYCECQSRQMAELLRVVGIPADVEGQRVSYWHKWDGEVLFERTLWFITEDQSVSQEGVSRNMRGVHQDDIYYMRDV
jgi:hypothetical protein